MKRRGKDALTGGTKDVSPQLLTASLTMTAANTFTSGSIVMPQNKFQSAKDTAIVVECLKIFFNLAEADANPAAAGSVLVASATLSTRQLTAILPGDSTVFGFCDKNIRGAFTAAGTYGTAYFDPYCMDVTDGDGHGVLIATDQIFLAMNTIGYTAAGGVVMKMLYRFKEISLPEYIGIVQSQS